MPSHMPSLAMHTLAPSKWSTLNLSAINADLLAQERDSAWAAQTRQVPATAAKHCAMHVSGPFHLQPYIKP